MKKVFKRLMIVLIFLCTIFTTVACGGIQPENPEVAPPPAEETSATAFEVMEKATSKLDATNSALTTACTQTEAPVVDSTTRKLSAKSLSQSNVGSFRKADMQEYIARQQFVSYVFYNVSYALMSCKAENGYVANFELGKTFYGPATNTPDDNLNALLQQTQSTTKLAITVSQEIDGISFIVDWDMRHPYLEENMPIYNTVYMVNGYIKYDYKSNQVREIVINTFQTEKSGQFWVSKIDYTTNSFVYIEGYRTQIWNDFNSENSKTSLAELFNNGSLSYDKICEYPYNGLFVGVGNISNNINDVKFEGYWKFCSDINNAQGRYLENNVSESKFGLFYNFAYGYNLINSKIYDLKMRDKIDTQELSGATQVDFMNDAVTFGTNKTTCIFITNAQDETKYDACIMPFIEFSDLKNYISNIKTMLENSPQATQGIKALANNAFNFLDQIGKDKYLGNLGAEIKLEYITPNSTSIRWNTFTTSSFNYRISLNGVYIDFTISNNTVQIISFGG